jgi:beta-lactamase class A
MARAQEAPPAVADLRSTVRELAGELSGRGALEVLDLSTGYRASYDAGRSMPAASTIKIPVMVEVFRELEAGRFDLQTHVTLRAHDKDWGSGDLCDAPVGSSYTVGTLLGKMIDVSDNTATNMLIRLVGLRQIDATMSSLGLDRTRLTGDIRTDGWAIRTTLRTSPDDLARLLTLMAQRRLVDEWSSSQMVSILEGSEINTLLPQGLPDDIEIAHKTGSLNDTLNDAGIVYASQAPYVIVVMTTGLSSLDEGRSFIRSISRTAYSSEMALAQWRQDTGAQNSDWSQFMPASGAPDVKYWAAPATPDEGSGG